MKSTPSISSERQHSLLAFTLVEVMVAAVLATLILTVVAALTIYGMRTFAATTNYVDLDTKSRAAVDEISRDIRNSTGLKEYLVDATTRRLAFDGSNGVTTLTWTSTTRALTTTKNGVTKTNLSECDSWTFELFARAPTKNTTNLFTPFQGGLNHCKMVSMTWRCSRTMMGKKWNTETVQTTKVVLRNAQ